jgi:hypothetical protein
MELNTRFEQNFTTGSTELELDVLGVPGKLVTYVVYLSKKKLKKKSFFFTQAAIDQFLVSRNFRG